MTLGSSGSSAGGWSQALVDLWPAELRALVGNVDAPTWDPSSLLGAAFAKEGKVTLDAMLYENSVLGVNSVSQTGTGVAVDYFEFTDGVTETYDYDRAARYSDVRIGYYMNTDADPDLEYQEGYVYDVVFQGQNWADEYIALAADGQSFETGAATDSGANDFAQAADDAREVILFMHTYDAFEIVGVG